ncbi:NADH:flavin oxidoreductase/NADH oxidase [Sutterella sp.]|uniref:NADH:flavin oxidoreductase/NADH oxidase n=1 Tax=Sutterella sp. TaxID=1981025 RepID=UPI0026DFFA6B|nr:NADH:flavin oxidoreductase/NADH oxidase [Sutterella sp.]MDO5531869.1 NADH:flavin oxidoreductase/NADH oxidase [Sutterella sp.]
METMLFSPIKIGPMTVANRIAVPPMDMYSARSGVAQPFHFMHYGSLAASGAGLICIETTAVTPEGRISDADLGLWSDECEKGLKNLVAFMREIQPGVKIIIQLNHAGRKASIPPAWKGTGTIEPADGGWLPRAPSAIAFGEGFMKPRALETRECEEIIAAFGEAAARAVRAGVDGIEIHMAHGYLIHQFLSPLSNHRIDAYGGALEHRMRFAHDVMNAVKTAVPENTAVGIRVSATDWEHDGWTLEETLELVKVAKAQGMHFVDVSTGGNTPSADIPVGPGYQVPFARRVREESGLPVFAVGLITEAWQAETILRDGAADIIDIGREMLADPRWGWNAARALGVKKVEGVSIPVQWERGLKI